MMQCSALLKSEAKKRWDGFVCGFYEGEKEGLASLGKIDRELEKFFEGIFQNKLFEGKEKEIFFTYLPNFKGARSILFVGLGKRDQYHLEGLRKIVGQVLKQAQERKLSTLGLDVKTFLPQNISSQESGRAVIESVLLSTFRFQKYKTAKNGQREIRSFNLLCGDNLELKEIRTGMKFGKLVGEATNLARSLANEPANQMTPRILARKAQELAKEVHLVCKILNEVEIKKLGMGGLLGVAQGSPEPPRFIVLETRVESKARKPVVLVGKGITFDSGGISLKPAHDMEKMKYDMSGAAAVIAICWLAAQLKLPFKLVGLVPTCENLPSEHPQRPGDIVTISNGKTVEVINTDAEGRLILADGLSYALRYRPHYLIDLATLTGSCRQTFGEFAIGMMGHHRTLLDSLKEAGERSGERCWELPLWEDYKEHIKSDVADLKNVGKGTAGAIVGGKFLEEFVGDTPWAHLDIASTGWFDENHDYISKGASGAGVRLLAQFLKDLQ